MHFDTSNQGKLKSALPFLKPKTDKKVTSKWAEKHLEIGIKSMTEIEKSGERIKHFRY